MFCNWTRYLLKGNTLLLACKSHLLNHIKHIRMKISVVLHNFIIITDYHYVVSLKLIMSNI